MKNDDRTLGDGSLDKMVWRGETTVLQTSALRPTC